MRSQPAELSRKELAEQSLEKSAIIVTDDLGECVKISNEYGPEHLIIQTENAADLVNEIENAGSVFVGAWTPESVGDYASGTNHVLPTYGYTKSLSGLGLDSFMKQITVQSLSADGLKDLGPTVMKLASVEGLDAHKNAVALRLATMEASSK